MDVTTWWCWTENEPSTFRCRERSHDVRELTPGTPVGISERAARQSTSAELRETQGALAASQADLTAMERQRDEAKAQCRFLNRKLDDALAELQQLRGES